MALSESLLATLITGGVGICGILVSRFKCMTQFDGCCSLKGCKIGLTDASIVDENEVSVKTVTINGVDLAYRSKNFVQIDSDDEHDGTHNV